MEYAAIVALLVGACFGILLAARHFTKARLPVWAAVFHGLAGATGFALLLATVISDPSFSLAKRALFVLVFAVLMGCVNVVFHIRGVRHRTSLILGHATLAVAGVTTLGFAIVMRMPAAADVSAEVVHAVPLRSSLASALHTPTRAQREAAPAVAAEVVPARAVASAPVLAPAPEPAPEPASAPQTWSVAFGPGSVRVEPGALEEIARSLSASGARMEVRGHTDERGTSGPNRALARARAQAALDALVALGVSRASLVPVSYGDRCPADPSCRSVDAPASCHTTEAWGRDRRVELAPALAEAPANDRDRTCP